MRRSSYLRHHAEIGQEDSQGMGILLRPPTCSELEASLKARIRFLEAVYIITNVTYHTQFRTQALYVIHTRLLRWAKPSDVRCTELNTRYIVALHLTSQHRRTYHSRLHFSALAREGPKALVREEMFTNVDPVTPHNCLARSAQSASLTAHSDNNLRPSSRFSSAILHALMRYQTKDPKYCSFSKPRVESVCSETTCVYRC